MRKKGEHTPSHSLSEDLDDTEKDHDTEKDKVSREEALEEQRRSDIQTSIESASFGNDRTISNSDFRYTDPPKNVGVDIVIDNSVDACQSDIEKVSNKSDIRDVNGVGGSGSSDSTPEENTQLHGSHDSTPEDDRVYSGYNSPSHKLLAKVKHDSDVDCVSIASDYSEVSVPLRELTESEVEIVQKTDLTNKSFIPACSTAANIQRNPEETDEEFRKRVRKINLLSIAQEFADLKKVNAKALPLGLHKCHSGSQSSSEASSKQSSAMSTPCDPPISNGNMNYGFSNNNNDVNCNVFSGQSSTPRNMRNDNDKSPAKSRVHTTDGTETEGDFDVYNMETAVPNIDWDSLEQQLQQATQDQKLRQQVSDTMWNIRSRETRTRWMQQCGIHVLDQKLKHLVSATIFLYPLSKKNGHIALHMSVGMSVGQSVVRLPQLMQPFNWRKLKSIDLKLGTLIHINR